MTTLLTLRSAKGSPLSNTEMDNNFINLRTTADQALAAASSGSGSGTGTGTSSGGGVGVGTIFPSPAEEGELFYRTDEDQLYVYVGGSWVTASVAYTGTASGTGIEIVTALPPSGTAGQVIFNKGDDKLYKWSGTAWVAAVPTITSTQVTDGSITTPKLATNSITSDKIVANSITAGKVAAGAIGATEIAANAITADKIAANSITAGKLAVGAITAASLTASPASATMNGVNFWLGGSQTVLGNTVCFNLDKSPGGSIPLVASASRASGIAGYFLGPATGIGSGMEAYGQVAISGTNTSWRSFAQLGTTDTKGVAYGIVAGSMAGGTAGVFHRFSSATALIGASPAIIQTVGLCNGTYGIQLFGSAVGTFTGAHDAVYPDNAPVLEIGDIVVDVAIVGTPSINEVLTEVALATKPNDRTVVGVVSALGNKAHIPSALATYENANTNGPSSPVLVLNAEYRETLDHSSFIAINAVGEGCINVCGLNGDIEAGDLIVSSTLPGKGMKQDDDIIRSCTVAKARTSVTFASPTEVKQIPCIYHCG